MVVVYVVIVVVERVVEEGIEVLEPQSWISQQRRKFTLN